MKRTIYTIFLWLGLSVAFGQESVLQLNCRQMALDYNRDIRAAQENIAASIELIGAAKADLKPSLVGGASYQFLGHPTELNLTLPSSGDALHFEGQHNRYGVLAALNQPLYAGGRLLASLRKAEHQRDYARGQEELLRNAVSLQSDLSYWGSVAQGEMVRVAEDSKQAVETLVKVIRQRVELGFSDPTDLLMAEVKLNESDYLLQQMRTRYATSVMSLNSLIGLELTHPTEIDTAVIPIVVADSLSSIAGRKRPEQKMVQSEVAMLENDRKIVYSKFLPQLSIGAEGSFKSPSYDFTPHMKFNYGVYAKLTVPIFEWNKRGKESRAAQHRINMVSEKLHKVDESVALERATARLSLVQATERVSLTSGSLAKAFENERRSTERYVEGRLSVMEVLQVQLYRQNAQINYIEAKLAAQNSWSRLQQALYLYAD